MRRRPPPLSEDELRARAETLAGHTLGELAYALETDLDPDPRKTKGKIGALFEAGRIPQLRVNNAANQVKQAEDSLANQLDAYTLALDRFKVRLGLPVTTPVVIDASELPISEPDVDINQAVEALAKGTEEFAAARMNRGIRQALAGRSIEDV